jgi:uncharacterized protein
MLLDLKALRGGRSVERAAIAPDDPLLGGFFGRLTRPLEVTASISEQPHRTYLVRLEVRAEVESPCRRCLKPTRQRVQEGLDLLIEVRDPAKPRPAAGPEDAEVLAVRSEAEPVDVGPFVREALFLAAENFPICRADCRGLCAGCGRDLNVEACVCEPRTANPRWRGLEKLRS